MTIELDATAVIAKACEQHHEEIVQFIFGAAAASGLLQRARALLDAAPKELSESFEQAVRTSGLAS